MIAGCGEIIIDDQRSIFINGNSAGTAPTGKVIDGEGSVLSDDDMGIVSKIDISNGSISTNLKCSAIVPAIKSDVSVEIICDAIFLTTTDIISAGAGNDLVTVGAFRANLRYGFKSRFHLTIGSIRKGVIDDFINRNGFNFGHPERKFALKVNFAKSGRQPYGHRKFLIRGGTP